MTQPISICSLVRALVGAVRRRFQPIEFSPGIQSRGKSLLPWSAFSVLLLAWIGMTVGAQGQVLTRDWVQRYDSSVHKVDLPAASVADSSGDVFVTGSYTDADNISHMRTAKYSGIDGHQIWERLYGTHAAGDFAMVIALSGNGDVVVAGVSGFSCFAAKYSSATGAPVWERTANGPNRAVRALAIDVNGDVVLTGSSTGEITLIFGTPTFLTAFHTVKYSGITGSLIWENQFSGVQDASGAGNGIATDPQGNVVVAGYAQGTSGDRVVIKYAGANGAQLWRSSMLEKGAGSAVSLAADGSVFVSGRRQEAPGKQPLFTAKYDGTSGATLWENFFDAAAGTDGFASIIDAAGDVIMACAGHRSGEPPYTHRVIKYAAADGALLWRRDLGASGSFDFNPGLARDASGTVYLAGSTYEDSNREHTDLYAVALNSATGAVLWEQQYDAPDGNGDESSAASQPLALTADGGLVVVGNVTVSGNFPQNSDWVLVKYSPPPAPTFITTVFPTTGGTLQASGGFGPLSFAVVGQGGVLTSELPTGQTLTSAGIIEGLAEPGPYTITVRVSETTGPARSVDKTFTFTAPGVPNKLKVEMRTLPGSELRQGGLVNLEFTVTNAGTVTLKDVRFHIEPLNGSEYINFVIQQGFDSLAFLDANGVPSTPPLDPLTRKRVVLPGSATNPRLRFNTQGIEYADFGLGAMKGGAVIKLRAVCRIAYDWPVGETLRFDGARATCKLNKITTIERRVAPRDFVVAGAAPGAGSPQLALTISQLAAGNLDENPQVAIITRAGLGVPGVKPARLSNQITYFATFSNLGNASAAYIRLVLPIPPGTAYKAGSAKLRIGTGDLIAAGKPKRFGNLLIFDVPNLEKNFPVTPGSAKTLQYTVSLTGVPKPPEGTLISHLGGAVTSRELRTPATTLRQNVVQVVKPTRMIYEASREVVLPPGATADSPAGTIYHRIHFRNQGDVAATQVRIRYTLAPGLAFQDAAFVKIDGSPDLSRNSAGIVKPEFNATSGEIVFPAGTVRKNQFGCAQITLKLDPNTRPNGSSADTTPDGAYRSEPSYDYDDASTVAPALLTRSANSKGNFSELHRDTALARTFIIQAGPASVAREGQIVYQVGWGNMSAVTAGVGAMYFGIPQGTELIDASGTSTYGNPANDDAIYRGPGENPEFPNGYVIWVSSLAPNSVKTATVRVQVKPGFITPVYSEQLRLGLDQSGVRFGARIGTAVLNPKLQLEAQQKNIYAASAGRLADASLGTAPAPAQKFLETIKQISSASRSIGISAADYVHISGNDGVVIPLGNNRTVAVGAADLVVENTAQLVAAGGLNVVTAGSGGLTLAVPGSLQGSLTTAQLISNAPALLAAGRVNLVDAGGLNLIQKIGVIGQNGANLIGLDGATLVGLDGGTLGVFSQKPGSIAGFVPASGAAVQPFTANAATLFAGPAGNLGFAKGGNLLGVGITTVLPPNTLVGNEGGTLFNNDGASVIGQNGANVIGQNGASVIGQNGASLIGNDSAGLRGSGAGSLISGATGSIAPPVAGR